MNCIPKVRQKKSNFGGVFIMKLTYEDKIQIYELRKQGQTFNQLSIKFGVDASGLRYMMRLIDRYGIEFALEILLKIIRLARSTYYYHLKQLDQSDKDDDVKAEIQSIYTEHKGNYGYRRMTLELRKYNSP